MRTRLRTLAAVAAAATAFLAPAAHAGTRTTTADEFLTTSVALARATADATGMFIEIDVPGTDGSPCFRISVAGPGGLVRITFWRPIVNCIV